MRKIFLTTMFMLATLAWAAAQQPSGQATSPMGQSQSATPGSPGAAQNGMQPGAQPPTASTPITEGCLGGSNPNFTVTDKAGTTYKLNIPPSADTSKLAQHVGEPVQVQGNVNSGSAGTGSIDVTGIGRGMGTCPSTGSSGTQSMPKR